MIQIQQLNHHLGKQPILKDINLTIPNGGITALIGPNGAGKSTLLALMARLQPIQTGKILLDGMDIQQTPSKEIAKHLAILTQENTLHSRITVRDLLMFGRYPHHQGNIQPEDRQVVEQMLDRFRLTDLAPRFLTALSGGQRQRALIAMTFCQQTSHILLDEPLNNLDMFHARELMRLLRQLTDQLKLTTVMVVHDINMAAAYADTIVTMKAGHIEKVGTPDEVLTKAHIQHIFSLDVALIDYKQKKVIISHL
ncbi:ABC transporter ATP-binding protein [Pasteurella sp. PK-2025]|uniref:iron ABC transporter ATP-binding protein n=1 Tax=unclassified Pasteurella TaxID=2621516 RepID=UPI003C75CF2D